MPQAGFTPELKWKTRSPPACDSRAARSAPSWEPPRCSPAAPPASRSAENTARAVSEAGLKVYKFRDERPADKELLERVNATAGSLVRGAGAAADIGVDLHARNISSILAAWEEGKDAETSGLEGRKSVSIINALYESARNDGAPTDVV